MMSRRIVAHGPRASVVKSRLFLQCEFDVSLRLSKVSRRLHFIAGLAATVLLLPWTHCAADIWGYVDEHGVAHLSHQRVDNRYQLFRKEPERPVIEAFVPPPVPAPYFASAVSPNAPVIPVSAALRAQFAPLIARVAQEFSLDPMLLHAIITVESGYNPLARSTAGATGLMQLMPQTAARYGVRNILDPLENLQGGARYLRFLLELIKNNLDLALAAYNAGEGAVMQAGNRIPNYAETRAYVPSVLTHYDRYKSTAPLIR
jgi:soluble lytic murein transglycosylase-like protein